MSRTQMLLIMMQTGGVPGAIPVSSVTSTSVASRDPRAVASFSWSSRDSGSSGTSKRSAAATVFTRAEASCPRSASSAAGR